MLTPPGRRWVRFAFTGGTVGRFGPCRAIRKRSIPAPPPTASAAYPACKLCVLQRSFVSGQASGQIASPKTGVRLGYVTADSLRKASLGGPTPANDHWPAYSQPFME